jgi:PAS domain S-box-containing protein
MHTKHIQTAQNQNIICKCSNDSAKKSNLESDRSCDSIKKQLKSAQKLNEMIFQNAPVIIIVLNTQGCIEMFNPFMEKLSGYQLSEVKGKDWFRTFLPLSIQEQVRGFFFKAINNIHTQGYINPIVTKSGEEIDISWYDNTLRDSDNNVIGLLCMGHDISSFEKAKNKAESIRQTKKDFLDSMGHEIRTPMNAIIGFSEILSEMITDHKQKEYLNTIKTSVQALLSVLDQTNKAEETQLSHQNISIDPDNVIFKRNTKILVVDDISTNRYVLSHYLKEYDFQILQADNGKSAIDMATAHQPDLIFMDYHMPVLDGYRAAKIINNEIGLSKIPIVIVTASVTQEILDIMETEGFTYIKKPFHKKAITVKIMELIPYTEKGNDNVNDIKISGNTSYDIKETVNKLENFSEFKTVLEAKFYPQWKSFHKKLYIEKIKEWALDLNEKALSFSCEPVQDYSNRILDHIESFDLVSLQNKLNLFPDFLGIT